MLRTSDPGFGDDPEAIQRDQPTLGVLTANARDFERIDGLTVDLWES